MSTSATVLQLHQREVFEDTVTRALGAGAAAGLLQHLLGQLGTSLPLAPLVLAACVAAAARGDRLDRALVAGLGCLAAALPYALGLAGGWGAALGAAGAGALFVRARLNGQGEEGQVAARRPTLAHFVLGALLCAALARAGLEVAGVFAAHLAALATPAALGAMVAGALVGLFVGLSAAAAHLALSPDPVEARGEALLPQLSGELHALAERALRLYRQCGASLATLPRQPAREELARSLSRLTQEALELAAEWAGVEAHLAEQADGALAAEAEALERQARACVDGLARRQLALAAASLREEQERLAALGLQRERILARLKAQVALLEGARVALLSLRSGQAQLRATGLCALSRRFQAMASAQADEGQALDSVASGAALAQLEDVGGGGVAEAARGRERRGH